MKPKRFMLFVYYHIIFFLNIIKLTIFFSCPTLSKADIMLLTTDQYYRADTLRGWRQKMSILVLNTAM